MLLDSRTLKQLRTFNYDFRSSGKDIQIFDIDKSNPAPYGFYQIITLVLTFCICLFYYNQDKNGKNFVVVLFLIIGSLVTFVLHALKQATTKYHLYISQDKISVKLPRKKAKIPYQQIRKITLQSEYFDFNNRGFGGKVRLYSIYCEYKDKEILLINFSDSHSPEAHFFALEFQMQLEKLIQESKNKDFASGGKNVN